MIYKFDDYYIFNSHNNMYYCKLCGNFKETKIKFFIERHLDEQHFFLLMAFALFVEIKNLSLDEHIKRCQNLKIP